jgi:hypothetical protein
MSARFFIFLWTQLGAYVVFNYEFSLLFGQMDVT